MHNEGFPEIEHLPERWARQRHHQHAESAALHVVAQASTSTGCATCLHCISFQRLVELRRGRSGRVAIDLLFSGIYGNMIDEHRVENGPTLCTARRVVQPTGVQALLWTSDGSSASRARPCGHRASAGAAMAKSIRMGTSRLSRSARLTPKAYVQRLQYTRWLR